MFIASSLFAAAHFMDKYLLTSLPCKTNYLPVFNNIPHVFKTTNAMKPKRAGMGYRHLCQRFMSLAKRVLWLEKI